MKNTIIISDIHGRDYWKQMLNQHDNIEKIIFLGDYFDSFDIPFEKQLSNFLDILELKKSNQFEIVMLLGNHDYIPNYEVKWSGYQKLHAREIEQLIKSNLHHLQICHRDEEYIFSHAGLSIEWLNKLEQLKELLDSPDNIDNIIDTVNMYLKYQSRVFDFGYFEERYADEGGDDEWQGPTWIRPRALKKANYEHWLKNNFIQIVGHTGVDKIDFLGKSTGGRYYFVDTMHWKNFEYLTIINNQLNLNLCHIH
jgi:predicted phosphodiesterase